MVDSFSGEAVLDNTQGSFDLRSPDRDRSALFSPRIAQAGSARNPQTWQQSAPVSSVAQHGVVAGLGSLPFLLGIIRVGRQSEILDGHRLDRLRKSSSQRLAAGGRWIRTFGPPCDERAILADPGGMMAVDFGRSKSGSQLTRRWRRRDSNRRSPVRVCRRIETTDHHFEAGVGGRYRQGLSESAVRMNTKKSGYRVCERLDGRRSLSSSRSKVRPPIPA
jgi:hypothetical protein